MTTNIQTDDESLTNEVYHRKNWLLKERLRTLIKNKGMSEAYFYNSIGLSKQYWYLISWGLKNPTIDIKVKIAKALDSDSSLIWQEQKE